MITNEDDAPDKPLFADSAQNAYLNDFLFLCLNNIHRGQCLSLLKFVSGDPESIKTQVERVYPEIEEGERCDEVPVVKVYSKELVAYMSSFLPVAPYFRRGSWILRTVRWRRWRGKGVEKDRKANPDRSPHVVGRRLFVI